LVISPLKSLMQDQSETLWKFGVSTACIGTEMSAEELKGKYCL